jgi:hypothetical protein
MSSAPPAETLAITSPVAGFSVSNVSPDAASANWPSMNAWVRSRGRAAVATVVSSSAARLAAHVVAEAYRGMAATGAA